ncbi:MAG: FecR domain-containing protein [Merismopedia sp. SIO2A8]|nr:FecR domain-containing protein [Merismopedia sp. SIO2A8]
MGNSRLFLPLLVLLTGCCVPSAMAQHATPQKNLRLQVDRWIEVEALSGTVSYQQAGSIEPAEVGDRLQQVGDAIRTDQNGRATLRLDTDAGRIDVAPETSIRVQQLTSTSDGGKITRLQVMEGHARLQVTPFNHPDSALEIETPAGTAAVRGTTFGLNVDQDGTMSLATLEGEVWVEAQGEGVSIQPGFRTVVIPGNVPQFPQTQTQGALLTPKILQEVEGRAELRVHIIPGTLVTVDGVTTSIGPTGELNLTVPMPENRTIAISLLAPSGQRQEYQLIIPPLH